MRIPECYFPRPVTTARRLKLERRHLMYAGSETTIALEGFYWTSVDALASRNGVTWTVWVEQQLAKKPAGVGRARWLRVTILDVVQQPAAEVITTGGEPAKREESL